MAEISNLLVASYGVPFVKGDFRISLYLYKESDVQDVLFSQYYDAFPKDVLAGNPSLSSVEMYCIDREDEFVILINEDKCPPEERVNAMLEGLFHAILDVSEGMESEEFGARLIGDAFKKMAPALDPGLSSAEASGWRGLSVSEYALPLISDNYRITLNMYDEATLKETMMKLRDVYKAKMLAGEFYPKNNYGFMAEPSVDELGVFINCDKAGNLLAQQMILVHELFHATRNVIRTFDDSSQIGARLYRSLFEKFTAAMSERLLQE